MNKRDIAVTLWALVQVAKEDGRVVSFVDNDAFFGVHRPFSTEQMPSGGYMTAWSYNGFGGGVAVPVEATIDDIEEKVDYD